MYKSDIGYKVKNTLIKGGAGLLVLFTLATSVWGGTKLYSKIQENSKNKEDTVMVDTSAYDEQEAKWLAHVKNHNCELSHTDAERLNQIYTKLATLDKGQEGDSLVAELIAHMEGCDKCYQQKVTGPAKEDPTGPTGPTESTGPAEEDEDKDVVVDEKEDPTQGDGQGNGNGQGDGDGQGNGNGQGDDDSQGNGNGQGDNGKGDGNGEEDILNGVIIEQKTDPLEQGVK